MQQQYEKIIWLYWQNPYGQTQMPIYLQLCLETIKRHCGTFEVKLLNENTVLDYINLPEKINHVPYIMQKADYIRYALLQKYGGIWLDIDCILLRDIDAAVLPYLDEYKYIGLQKKTIYNNFIASVKQGDIINEIVQKANITLQQAPPILFKERLLLLIKMILKGHAKNMLNNPFHRHLINFSGNKFGSDLLKEIVKNHPYYRHKMDMFVGIGWSRCKIYHSMANIDTYVAHKPFSLMLFNSDMQKPLKHKTRQQLLTEKTLLSQAFRLALDIEVKAE